MNRGAVSKATLSPAPSAGVAAAGAKEAAASCRAGEPRVPSAPHSGSGVSARPPASADMAGAASAPPSLGGGVLVFTPACAAACGGFRSVWRSVALCRCFPT